MEQHGFEEIFIYPKSLYARADIRMSLDLMNISKFMKRILNIKIAEQDEAIIVTQILTASFFEVKEVYTTKAYDATVISSEQIANRMKNGFVWLAFFNDEAVGTISGKIIGETFYIQGMAVLPQRRGKKIAYSLLKVVEKFAYENNCMDLLLNTTPYLNRAIRLYDKFGFKIINEPPYELYGTPLFNMKKTLVYV